MLCMPGHLHRSRAGRAKALQPGLQAHERRQSALAFGKNEQAYSRETGLRLPVGKESMLVLTLPHATCRVRFLCESHESSHELFRLAPEKSVLCETLNRGDRAAKSVIQRSDDRASGKILANEFTWDRKNQ